MACGPSGGLFGIDQEVVTLRGLYGNSGIPDRPASGGSNPYFTGSMRAVAPGASFWCLRPKPRSEQPSSKSQPPHLVFGYIYYCLLNLSSDHLLSGVKRRIVRNAPSRQPGETGVPGKATTAWFTLKPSRSTNGYLLPLHKRSPGFRSVSSIAASDSSRPASPCAVCG
jgi:hypothetical protein